MLWGIEGEKGPEVTPRRKLFVEYLMPGTVRPQDLKISIRPSPGSQEKRGRQGEVSAIKKMGLLWGEGRGELIQRAIKRKHKRTARQSM